jgi:hypothetical protein
MKNGLLIAILLSCSQLFGQGFGIGQWKDYLPYSDANSVVVLDDIIYVAAEQTLFIYDLENDEVRRLNKIQGLSDFGVADMEKVEELGIVVIAYTNGNIDLIDGNQIINISDIKNANIIGFKTTNKIYVKGEVSYLCTSFGIVELNFKKQEINNTYYLNETQSLNVNDLIINNQEIIAATDSGIYTTNINSNLLDYNEWQKTTITDKITSLVVNQDQVYFTNAQDSIIYKFTDNSATATIEVPNLRGIKNLDRRMLVFSQKKISEWKNDELIDVKQHPFLYFVNDAIQIGDKYWAACSQTSLVSFIVYADFASFFPQGPNDNTVFSVTNSNDKVFISPGGINAGWNNVNADKGVYWYNGVNWGYVSSRELDFARDITTILEASNGDLYLGTWNDGILQLRFDPDINNYSIFKKHNYATSNGGLNAIEVTESNPEGKIRIKGMAFDNEGNLWAANSLTAKSLAVMKPDQEWQSFNFRASNISDNHLGDLLIDDFNQKWFYIAKGGGLAVYNDNNTIDISSDDQSKLLNTAVGNGGLPSSFIYSLAKDRDGEIWIGTDMGIAVIYSPESVFSGFDFDAQQILVETEDGYVEPILANEKINAIAVDGANRKWIGTQSSGIFLYSADGTEQLLHFTQENSPLFSNLITDIDINQKTGEVFIGTEEGLISYNGGAITGQETHGNVVVYPNPVREDYYGPIAIKNLVEDAQVKITDVNGRLVREITALGGQAVWDGKNGDGQRVSTGIYLVFSSNSIGSEAEVSKILFIQ